MDERQRLIANVLAWVNGLTGIEDDRLVGDKYDEFVTAAKHCEADLKAWGCLDG